MKDEAQLAPARPQPDAQQAIQRHNAGKLVAMGGGEQRHMRAGSIRPEGHNPWDARIARTPGRYIRCRQLHVKARQWQGGTGLGHVIKRSARRWINPSQASNCDWAIHSSGLCAWAMSPGPQTMVGIPAF